MLRIGILVGAARPPESSHAPPALKNGWPGALRPAESARA
jgi:hypothetical protein